MHDGGSTFIAEGTKLLLERGVDLAPEALKEDSGLILEQVKRMSRIIEHQRSFARDRSGKPKEQVELNDVVHSALQVTGTQLVWRLARRRELVCSSRFPPPRARAGARGWGRQLRTPS